MRRLPRKPNNKQKRIIAACEDFYAGSFPVHIALFLMGRKARLPDFSEDDKTALWYIERNLQDEEYLTPLEISHFTPL